MSRTQTWTFSKLGKRRGRCARSYTILSYGMSWYVASYCTISCCVVVLYHIKLSWRHINLCRLDSSLSSLPRGQPGRESACGLPAVCPVSQMAARVEAQVFRSHVLKGTT